MALEWYEARNRADTLKHGIDFVTARRIFDGSVLTRRYRHRDYGEERHVSIGRVDAVVIVVAHTARGGSVRLISARSASRKERRA